MKFYIIKGLIFYQRELTYAEDISVKDIIDKYTSYFAQIESALDFGALVQKIFDDGLIPRLFSIILKEGVFRIWNAPLAIILKVDRKNIARHSRNSTIARVIWDFFLINTKLIRKYARSRKTSGLTFLESLMKVASAHTK